MLITLFPLCLSIVPSFAIGAETDKLANYQQQYRHPDPQVRIRAVGFLGTLGPKAIPSLIEALRDDDRMVGHHAEQALRKIGPASLSALDGMLEDSHFEAPHRAAHAIVWMGPAAAPTIIKVLQEYRPDAWNRLYEVSNISNLPDETKAALVPKLIELFTHPDIEVQIRAMLYMGYMKPASHTALPHIVQALKGNTILRDKSARVLYGIGYAATPFLVQALQDPDPEVRRFVVQMLTSPAFSRNEVVHGLQQVCAGDSSPAIRQQAKTILQHSFRRPLDAGC